MTNAKAAGYEPRNFSIGLGWSGLEGPDAPMARRSSRNSAPVRTGKSGTEWVIISVCMRRPLTSGKWKRIASPRGSASPTLSGIWGTPVELENRNQTLVLGALK